MKKLLLTMLTVTMLVCLVACGGKQEETPTPTPNPIETPTQAPENNDTQTPENNEAATPEVTKDPVDEVAILDVQNAVTDLSGIEFGNFFMSEEIFDAQMAGFVIGTEDFGMEFESACHFAPMMSSKAFELAFFRVAEGTDVNAFADALREKADPIKWMCVQADAVKTAIRGNTILFVMSDEHTVDALINAFNSYDPATYVPTVKENPLAGKTMSDVYWNLASSCGFIEGATDGSFSDTAKNRLGFANLDVSACEDIYADYSSETGAYPYALGFFRLPEGTNAMDFAAYLDGGVDASAYGEGDYTIMYDEAERVVMYCIAESFDILYAFQDGVYFFYPDVVCYR